MKKYLEDNFYSEISNIEKETKVKISLVNDISIGNSEIIIEDSTKSTKKNENKPKKKTVKKRVSTPKKKNSALKKSKAKDKITDEQSISPIKEIKVKKSGWWQK